VHVDYDSFETCRANEWFRPCNLLKGFSPGELKINKNRYNLISDQIQELSVDDLDATIEAIWKR
jgi:hypothetical protein